MPPFTVNMAELANLDVLSSDADAGLNRCVADYYGLTSLSVAESES